MSAPDALSMLSGLALEDGRRWGEVATDWQRTDAAAVFADDGPAYHFLTRPRGGSKSSDLAAILIVWLLTTAAPAARAFVAAADRDQAALLVDAAAGFIERSGLGGLVTVQNAKLLGPNGASVSALAADGDSAFGLRPSWAVIDEVGQWASTRNARRVWTALVSAIGKVPGCRLVCLTSASEPSHWSHRVLESARKSPRWRTSEIPGPLPWVTGDFLAEQRALLMPSEYARYHLNEWQASEDRLVAAGDLAKCIGHDGPLDPETDTRYVAGLDLGLTRDRAVLSICHSRVVEDHRVIVLDRQIVWTGTREHPVELRDVEAACLFAAEKYGASFVFDPWQSAQLAQNLRGRRIGVTDFHFSQQSVGRLAQRLYHLLRDHALDLPNDPELVDELAHVRIRERSPGSYRMDHDADRHDDRAISLALAANELLEYVPRGKGARMRGPARRSPDHAIGSRTTVVIPGLAGVP